LFFKGSSGEYHDDGYITGIGGSVTGAVDGVVNTIANPIETIRGLENWLFQIQL